MYTEANANWKLMEIVDDRAEIARRMGPVRPVHPAALRALHARQDRWYAVGAVLCAVATGVLLAWRG